MEQPKRKLIGFRNVATNKGNNYKARTAQYTYNERLKQHHKYSMKEIERELNKHLQALRRLNVMGWAALSVQVNGKFYSTDVSIPFTRDVSVKDLIYNYFDDYYGETDNPLSGDETKHSIDQFKFYFTVVPPGGRSEDDNLCFYHCIKECGNIKFKKPSLFYTFCVKKPFASEITLEDAIKAAYLCKFNLYVEGDVNYVCPKPINNYPNYHLVLTNGHWTINHSKDKKIFNLIRKELPLMIYKKINDNEFEMFNKELGYTKSSTIDKKKYNNLNSKYFKEDKSLEQIYNDCVKEYTELKEITNGEINLFKTINKIKTNEFHIINQINKLKLDIDRIEQYEHLFINDATRGAYAFCKKGEYAKVYSYDVSKAYASKIIHSNLKIPIKKGTLTTVSQDEVDKIQNSNLNFKYGMYRALIEAGADKKFPYNNSNCYTHYDLKIAIQLGLKITISPQSPNALIYNKDDVVSGKKIFGDYIEKLYAISKSHPHIRVVKEMLSSMWGSVCAMKKIKKTLDEETTDVEIPETCVYNNIKWIGENISQYEMYDINRIYKYDIARMKPFLLAKQRLDMFNKIIKDEYDNIVYCRTDGVYTTKKLDFPDKAEMGEMRHECDYKNVTIKNMNNITKTKI